MTTYYKYRIRCTTDNTDECWILPSADPIPTTCPTNTAHTINSSLTSVIDIIKNDVIQIKEETVATGGNFGCRTVSFTATKNAKTEVTVTWPFPVSILSVDFVSTAVNKDDIVNTTIGKNTIIGNITANVSPASSWVSQNYTVGDKVTHTHSDPHYGTRVYTCILNTVSNEEPPNSTYWKHGYEINVSSTVIANTLVGYFLCLNDLTNIDSIGRVLSVDTINNKVYVETNPVNSFSAISPTYVCQTVKHVQDYIIGEPNVHSIGKSKIGASYIPSDIKINLEYDNKSIDTDKEFIGTIEFLY